MGGYESQKASRGDVRSLFARACLPCSRPSCWTGASLSRPNNWLYSASASYHAAPATRICFVLFPGHLQDGVLDALGYFHRRVERNPRGSAGGTEKTNAGLPRHTSPRAGLFVREVQGETTRSQPQHRARVRVNGEQRCSELDTGFGRRQRVDCYSSVGTMYSHFRGHFRERRTWRGVSTKDIWRTKCK